MITVAGLGVQDFVSNHLSFSGRIQYGCPILQATTAYSNSLVHEIILSCPNGPAVTLSSNMYANYEGPYATVYPTFTAPPGLLALFAFRPPVGTYYATPCSTGTPPTGYPNSGETFPGASSNPLLVSGAEYDYYGSQTSLSYCAVVKNSAHVDPFDVKWSYGYSGQSIRSSIAISAPNITLRTPTSLQYVNVTVTLRNLTGPIADVSLEGMTLSGPSLTSWNYLRFSFNPNTTLLNPNQTNSTVLTLQINSGENPGVHAIQVTAYPAYGLRFYGDYAGYYLYSRNSTTIYVQLT